MGKSEARKISQRKASAKYDASNTVQFKIKLNKNTESEMIEHLQSLPNRQGYIKDLIKEDMKKSGI